jgi:hypothetical protein
MYLKIIEPALVTGRVRLPFRFGVYVFNPVCNSAIPEDRGNYYLRTQPRLFTTATEEEFQDSPRVSLTPVISQSMPKHDGRVHLVSADGGELEQEKSDPVEPQEMEGRNLDKEPDQEDQVLTVGTFPVQEEDLPAASSVHEKIQIDTTENGAIQGPGGMVDIISASRRSRRR